MVDKKKNILPTQTNNQMKILKNTYLHFPSSYQPKLYI